MSSFRDDGAAALDWVARYLEEVAEYPVLSRAEPGAIRAALPAAPPDAAEPFSSVLRDLDEILMPGITHWQSPRYFAYFPASAAEPGILAELLIAALNQVGILWRASPALQELEEVTLDWLRQLVGLPEALHGHIEDTASSGLITALAAARAAAPDRKIVVCSEHTHSSTTKAARLLELELRSTPVDETFALRADQLDLHDACAVVATVGTTSSTAVDPIAAVADRAAAAGTWLHVDAAYAGAAAVCPELRHHFAGWERADSIGINPHKWLFTPMDCSAFFCRRPDDLRRAFSLVPEYLRVDEDVVSLSEYASPLGRRFRALKLWATLRCFGREGLQAIIREHVRLAALFEGWVEAEPGWELCAPRPFSLVCFRKVGSDAENEEIMRRANDSGEIFLSHTKLDGRFVLRLAIGNARTSRGRRRARLGRAPARGGEALARDPLRARRAGRSAASSDSTARRVALDLEVAGIAVHEEAVERRRRRRSRVGVGGRVGAVADAVRFHRDRLLARSHRDAEALVAAPARRGRCGRRAPASRGGGRRRSVAGRASEPPSGRVPRGRRATPRPPRSARTPSRLQAGRASRVGRRRPPRGSRRRAASTFVRAAVEPLEQIGVAERPVPAAPARRGATTARRRGRGRGRRGSTGCTLRDMLSLLILQRSTSQFDNQ